MATRFSVLFLVFGILNILAALSPPCAGCVGVNFFLKQPEGMLVNGRDIGPALRQHVDRNTPTASFEAFGAVACNWLLALLLVAGAIGLFVGHEWGRWLSIGAAVLMILTLCIHDIYQFAVLRPAMMTFFDQQIPAGPEREGIKIGFTGAAFLWMWLNPLLMLYLLAMCITLGVHAFMRGSAEDDRPSRRRRRRRDRDDDDD